MRKFLICGLEGNLGGLASERATDCPLRLDGSLGAGAHQEREASHSKLGAQQRPREATKLGRNLSPFCGLEKKTIYTCVSKELDQNLSFRCSGRTTLND